MKAVVLIPGTTNVRLVDRPEPRISSPDEVKLNVLQVGICGTDREETAGGRAVAPPGSKEIIIGHEMLGRVVEIGPTVTNVRAGDYATLTVRRGCGGCPACAIDRSDMCYTGEYADRGIRKQDGYQAEYVVDHERYVVPVPGGISEVGVLAEPMSIAEKGIDEALAIQRSRLPDFGGGRGWLRGRLVLVAGLGPIGILAAFALRLREARVLGLDIVSPKSNRARILQRIGGTYVDGRQSTPQAVEEEFGRVDVILEATGVAELEFDLLAALGRNGVYVLTGIPSDDRPINIDAPALARNLVLGNQVVAGSVNASLRHFEIGVADLGRASEAWGSALAEMITHRFPYTESAFALSTHSGDEIKAVIDWADGGGET